ncbi:MAG: hypothetical protein LBT59_14105 [Clostridiales bacterium]|jgi:hypothetical protein|nr:hypothetical protein [Clostridiales bacterium]
MNVLRGIPIDRIGKARPAYDKNMEDAILTRKEALEKIAFLQGKVDKALILADQVRKVAAKIDRIVFSCGVMKKAAAELKGVNKAAENAKDRLADAQSALLDIDTSIAEAFASGETNVAEQAMNRAHSKLRYITQLEEGTARFTGIFKCCCKIVDYHEKMMTEVQAFINEHGKAGEKEKRLMTYSERELAEIYEFLCDMLGFEPGKSGELGNRIEGLL